MESTGISTRVGIAGAVGIALFLAMLVGLRILRQDDHRSHATVQDHAPPMVIHYAPGGRPLCGNESWTAVYSDDPDQVAGWRDCLELVSDDLQDHNEYRGHCLQEISAQGGVEWRGSFGAPVRTAAARDGEHDNHVGRLG